MENSEHGSSKPSPIVTDDSASESIKALAAERLRLAERLISFGTWEWEVATGEVTWSAGMEVIYGLPTGTFGGTCEDFSRRVHPDDRAELDRVRSMAVQTGAYIDHLYRVIRPDGQIRWVNCKAEAQRDGLGTVSRVIGMTIDVTARKRTEDELAIQRARLATALKIHELAIFHQDTQLRYTWIDNPKLGASQEEVIGRTDAELLGKHAAKPLIEIKRRVLRTGRGERQEICLTREGYTGCFDLIVEPEFAADGSVTGIICAATDITLRKQAESRLALQADLLRSLAVGVNMVDAQATLRYTNPKFDALFGYAPGELIGLSAAVLNAPEGAEECAAEIMDALLNKGHWQGEVHNRRKDGSRFWTYAEIIAAHHPEFGELWITAQWDITDLHLARIARDRAFEAMTELSGHLQEQIEAHRLELAREVHDEIGATLTGIRMRMDASQLPLDADDVVAIRSDISRALEATRAVCFRLRPPMLDDLGLIETLRWYVRDWSSRTGIRIQFRFGDLPCDPRDPLRIDMFRMTQEILTNVARHAGATRVSLSLRPIGRCLTLRVRDDGRGFAAEAKEGFGLLGIRERLRRHQGYLVIESSEKGATISLSVPIPE